MHSQADRQIDIQTKLERQIDSQTEGWADLWMDGLTAGWIGGHRYRKSKIDCLRFVMCPLLVQAFQG